MPDDSNLRQDLLRRIDIRRTAVQAYLREHRPRTRRRMTWTVVLTSMAAVFTAGPAFGGETFAKSVQGALGLADESSVWRVLCLLALVVSVSAAVLTNIGKSHDDAGRLSTAEAVNAELEGLSSLLHFGHLTVEDGVKLYQGYTARIPFVDDAPGAGGYPQQGGSLPGPYSAFPQGTGPYGAAQQQFYPPVPGPYGAPQPSPYPAPPYGAGPYGPTPPGGAPYGHPPPSTGPERRTPGA